MTRDARHDRTLNDPGFKNVGANGQAAKYRDMSRWLGVNRIERVRAALGSAGIKLTAPDAGQITADDFVADVRLEPDDVIQLSCSVTRNDHPQALLERCAGEVGNVRFATSVHGSEQLVADTRVNGIAHLPQSLRDICAGFTRALGRQTAIVETASMPSAELLRSAIDESGWGREDVVEVAVGYELHVLLEGVRTTVQVSSGPGSVLVQRTVLSQVPPGTAGQSVSHQALDCNVRLRGCRLAISDGRLCVESRLHAEQISGDWLSFTVRAVAGVARCVAPELQLLAGDPAVADAYADMFCGPGRTLPEDTFVQAASLP